MKQQTVCAVSCGLHLKIETFFLPHIPANL